MKKVQRNYTLDPKVIELIENFKSEIHRELSKELRLKFKNNHAIETLVRLALGRVQARSIWEVEPNIQFTEIMNLIRDAERKTDYSPEMKNCAVELIEAIYDEIEEQRQINRPMNAVVYDAIPDELK